MMSEIIYFLLCGFQKKLITSKIKDGGCKVRGMPAAAMPAPAADSQSKKGYKCNHF